MPARTVDARSLLAMCHHALVPRPAGPWPAHCTCPPSSHPPPSARLWWPWARSCCSTSSRMALGWGMACVQPARIFILRVPLAPACLRPLLS